MNRKLDNTFARLKLSGRKGLMPFITAGYPSRRKFDTAVNVICESGADVLEIGFPHSDPLADGPVIQHSSHVAIARGFTVQKGFAMVRGIVARHSVPVVVMCYSNLILRAGIERFVAQCSDAGVSGLIVPDMIVEEGADLRAMCAQHHIAFINLVTPTTPTERAREIAATGSGFLYLVTVSGTTGARRALDSSVGTLAKRIGKVSSLPVCIGFGISSPEMVAKAARYGDGVIIGSKILQLIDADSQDSSFPTLRSFLKDVREKLGA